MEKDKNNDGTLTIDLSNHDLYIKEHIPMIFSKKRYIVSYGGRDSGKSYSLAQKCVITMLNEEYAKIICIRKTHNTIIESQFADIWTVIESWDLQQYFRICKSPAFAYIKCLVNGNTILSRGMDNPQKFKSISNPTHVFIEEADAINERDFHLINTSMRTSKKTKIQVMMSFNPSDANCWINAMFFPNESSYQKADGSHTYVKSIKEDTIILHSTFKMNPFITPDRINAIQALPKVLRDALLLGNWGGIREGVIYDKVTYGTEMPPMEECDYYGFSMDLGSTDPTVVVECAIKGENLYLCEICHESNLPVDGKHSIVSHLEKAGITSKFQIISDNNEPRVPKELNALGYWVTTVKKGAGSVLRRIELTQRYKIIIVGVSKNLKNDIKNYCWETDKHGNTINKPEHKYSHSCDAFSYFVLHHIGNPQKVISRANVGGLY